MLTRRIRKLVPYYSVALGSDSKKIIGETEVDMLRAIERTMSFTSAAQALGISYAHLWNSISRIERSLGVKVVRAERGGARGGMALLTEHGTYILQQYAELESQVGRFVSGRISGGAQISPHSGEKPSLSFIGSNCIVVERMLHFLHSKDKRMTYRILNVGSMAGLAAMMLREADLAGIHIFDEETQSYNSPLLHKYSLSSTCVLIRGYIRHQCLMVRRGNPKKIKGVEDLLRRDVKLANRNLGAGTRILLDHKLRELASERGVDLATITKRIRGYGMELMTHNQVADAVLSKRADVGVGLSPVASQTGLVAIPLAEENYDFVVEKRRRNPYVSKFIDLLSQKEFQEQVEATTPGIAFTPHSGEILP
jgi:molybdate transport repressor ModE-like protein